MVSWSRCTEGNRNVLVEELVVWFTSIEEVPRGPETERDIDGFSTSKSEEDWVDSVTAGGLRMLAIGKAFFELPTCCIARSMVGVLTSPGICIEGSTEECSSAWGVISRSSTQLSTSDAPESNMASSSSTRLLDTRIIG